MDHFPDVNPNHWAYDELKKLVETYQCVAGYPDGTFRGEQPATRYEMAGLLQLCLDRHLDKDSHADPPPQPVPAWLIALTIINSAMVAGILIKLAREM